MERLSAAGLVNQGSSLSSGRLIPVPAEERLRLYRRVLSFAKEGIAIQDAQGRIIEQNEAHLSLLGYPDAELLGKTPAYYLEGNREQFGWTMDDVLQKGCHRGDARCRTRSGKWVDVDLSVSIIRDDADEVIGYATYLRDITDKKRVESVLRESEDRFNAFMNTTSVTAFMRDVSSRYVYVNRAFEKEVGKPAAEILGKTPFEIWPAEIAKALVATDKTVLSAGRSMEFYERTTHSTQQAKEWLAIKFPFRDRRNKVLVGCVSVDITERKSLEEQLRQSQKMEAVGRLAGGIAHDFNNLLTIIIGYCELLLGRLTDEAGHRGKIQEIKKAGERAALLTRQLLAFSRKQVLAPRVLDLNSVIENLRHMIERLIGEDVDFATVPHDGLNMVRADLGQVEQIIMNLVVNARDAMPQGGKLTIETANIAFDGPYATSHPPSLPGEYVMIAVSDTGTGMDLETQKHIFEPFFTTKEKGKGTGLGLATVYGIVKQSGGFVWVYSEPDAGSTFKIYFPRVKGKAAPQEMEKAKYGRLWGSETVLVAEDEDSLRRLIRETLEHHGYKVLEATDGKNALRLIADYREPIHLLVTDLVMPHMSGRELAEQVSSDRPDIRILYISGYSDDAIVRHGILDTHGVFLQKPFSPQVLARKIRQVLAGQSDTRSSNG